jgi:signal peptidase I
MFFFGESESKRARKQAEQLVMMADKVDAYRQDIVPAKALEAMRAARARLQKLFDGKAPAGQLDHASEELHAAMLPCGGDLYPVTFWSDNIETVVAMGILMLGIRAFFLEPFEIPTNSMYPTYYGMTPYVYQLDGPSPSVAEQAWHFVKDGAVLYDVRAPAAGEIVLPVQIRADRDGNEVLQAISQNTTVQKWSGLWIFPSVESEYSIFTGQQAVPVVVPTDFDSGVFEAFLRTYFPKIWAQSWNNPTQLFTSLRDGGYLRRDDAGRTFLDTGKAAQAGDPVLRFDLRSGDKLFVDRFSYNFITPKPGDPIVFRTGDIPWLVDLARSNHSDDDECYIKRLVGLPGDVLEVHAPVLYRNGAPITGAAAFDKNARQADSYPGYTNLLAVNQGITAQLGEPVPPGYFFAMGDNSPESLDSRFWGGVPAHSVVGRALFIMYPFTDRVGWAR